jgi:hypothetical protein
LFGFQILFHTFLYRRYIKTRQRYDKKVILQNIFKKNTIMCQINDEAFTVKSGDASANRADASVKNRGSVA